MKVAVDDWIGGDGAGSCERKGGRSEGAVQDLFGSQTTSLIKTQSIA